MSSTSLLWMGLFVGSVIGGFVPELWGAGIFSFSAFITSTIGAILGAWLGYKASQW